MMITTMLILGKANNKMFKSFRLMLQELRETPAHPEVPDGRKLAELGQCKDNSPPLLCQLAVRGPSVGQ